MDDDEEEKPDIQPIENDTRNKEIIQTIVELEDEQEKNKKTRQDLERQKSNIVSRKDVSASNLKTVIGSSFSNILIFLIKILIFLKKFFDFSINTTDFGDKLKFFLLEKLIRLKGK